MKRAVVSDANAGGNALNNRTKMKMNQTWFASQMGPMLASMSARWACLVRPEASRSHTPPPKSAPPPST